jgi:hypothetical protein
MSYKLNITDNNLKINANVRYDNLSKLERPEIVAKSPTSKVVKERSVVNGKVIGQGELTRQWVDEDGNIYDKGELSFWYGEQQVSENQQSKVFEIKGYQPLKNYTDNYVISAYYELYPDDNGMKKDFDRDRAKQANLLQLRKLWEYLDKEEVVARGEFCTSSRGFIASDGYIRAIKFNGNKWGLEIGVFKEEKVFEHLNEGIPQEAKEVKTEFRRLKMV